MKQVRIVSISVNAESCSTYEEILQKAEGLILEAAKGSPDIIVLPEAFAHMAYPADEWTDKAETVQGKTISRFAKLAKRIGAIIIFPTIERIGKRIFNSAVFLSAKGIVLNQYHKTIPTVGEIEADICPGDGAVVVDTPMGRLGALICYDINFLEMYEALRRERPRIIFFVSAFRGGLRTRYLALECASYVVVANNFSNQLINPLGRLLNKAGMRQECFAALPQYLEETINLNFGVYHLDFNMNVLQKLRNKYAGKLRLEVAQAEAVFLLESLDPKLSIEKVEKEFKLERSLDYYDRARKAVCKAKPNFLMRKSVK